MTSLYANKVEGPNFRPVDTYILNPKAVSMGELYGEVNPLTLEWRDGLLGVMVRATVKVSHAHAVVHSFTLYVLIYARF